MCGLSNISKFVKVWMLASSGKKFSEKSVAFRLNIIPSNSHSANNYYVANIKHISHHYVGGLGYIH